MVAVSSAMNAEDKPWSDASYDLCEVWHTALVPPVYVDVSFEQHMKQQMYTRISPNLPHAVHNSLSEWRLVLSASPRSSTHKQLLSCVNPTLELLGEAFPKAYTAIFFVLPNMEAVCTSKDAGPSI